MEKENNEKKERYNIKKINYDWKKIGARIKLERENKDMTQEELAASVNVSRSTIIKWENARVSTPSIRDLLLLCNFFDCELGYLLCEYDCKERVVTDVQKETGLSEKAIEKIFKWKRSGFGDFSMDLISEMIEDDELLPEILRAGYDIEEIRNNRTQSAPKENIRFNHGAVTLVDPKTSINFLAFIIQKHITDFVFSYFQIKEDNSEDAEK